MSLFTAYLRKYCKKVDPSLTTEPPTTVSKLQFVTNVTEMKLQATDSMTSQSNMNTIILVFLSAAGGTAFLLVCLITVRRFIFKKKLSPDEKPERDTVPCQGMM